MATLQENDTKNKEKHPPSISPTIWALGFVSMFMDISSEMIHSLLPVFLISVLHTSTLTVGLIEGVAEAVALIVKAFSGILSDWIRKRKMMIFIGYALGTFTKPLFAIAAGPGMVFFARFLDRTGKGIRGAPRDALVADITHNSIRGAAFGLRQSLDTVGAFAGPMLAMLVMILTAGDFRQVFWIAVIPGVLALLIIIFAVKEPKEISQIHSPTPFSIRDIFSLNRSYWVVVIFGSVFTLARFSEAFLLLRGKSVGVTPQIIPLILVIMNVCYALTAFPAGRLSDRIGRPGLMTGGLIILIISDMILCHAKSFPGILSGAALWGMHMGMTQGLLSAMVADASGPAYRGTAFGLFSMACGVAMLISCLIAGWLWDRFGAPATFLGGAVFSTGALAIYILLNKYAGKSN
ncbi:MAG: MFS transporter [Proteobacteria bacterium]|nr:MFS transporter [Pseudomonadota bacterium]